MTFAGSEAFSGFNSSQLTQTDNEIVLLHKKWGIVAKQSKCQMCFQSTKQTLQLIPSYNFSSLYFWAETRLGLGTGTKDLEGSSSKTQTKQT